MHVPTKSRFPWLNTPGVSEAKGAEPPSKQKFCAPFLAHSALLSTGIGFQLPEKLSVLTIGLSYQVIAVFTESLLPSDRGSPYQVIVDK